VRRIYLLCCLVLFFGTEIVRGYGLLNNTGASNEDSLSVMVLSLDSLGNPIGADSFFVVIFKSNDNDVIFSDSGTTAMTGLDTVRAGAGITHYYYHRAVADIDGSGSVGQYAGVITAKHNTYGLLTSNRFSFQITGWELDEMGDSAGIAAMKSTGAIDSLAIIIDSLYAVLDTLQNHQAWVVTPSDVNINGDTLAVMGTNIEARWKRLAVSGANGSDGSFYVENTSGSGTIFKSAGSNGYGFYAVGNGTGAGAYFLGGLNGNGTVISSPGSIALSVSGASGVVFEGTAGSDITGNISGNLTGSVASVTGDVTINDNDMGVIADSMLSKDTSDISTGFAQMLKDTSAYQGNVAGMTISDIWEYGGGRTINGGYIDSNLTEQGGIAGGDKCLMIYTVDTSGVEDTLDGTFVTLQNSTGVVKAVMSTDASGKIEVVVPDGTWKVLASRHGYYFPDTAYTVEGNVTVAVYGFDVVIPPPAVPGICRIYGYLHDINNQPEKGAKISAYLPAGVSRAGNVIVSPFSVSTTSDSTGYFYMDLIPSDSLNPAGSKYEVTLSRHDGNILRQRVMVPAMTTWQLTW